MSALYLGMFTVSVLILGAFVYFSVGREIEREVDERIQSEMQALLAFAHQSGAAGLADEIRTRMAHGASFNYRLEDPEGRLIAGNLSAPVAMRLEKGRGWIRMNEPAGVADDDDVDWARAEGSALDNGARLLVAHDLSEVTDARRSVLVAFAWALIVVLALGTAGGLLLSAAFLRRIDAMNTAAEGVIAGNLRERIPSSRFDDDLARLAQTFNRMFDRIEKLIEANRHVSQNIAHDLRKPLARILRRLEAVRTTGSTSAHYVEVVDATIADVESVLETFNALLRIAQIGAGARRAGFRHVDIASIAAEVAEAFLPAAEEELRRMTISTSTPFPISGDPELLSQLVANLIDNVFRHTPAGCELKIVTALQDGAPQLRVEDRGPGVPVSAQRDIFERFYRVDTSRATPGDGLGLALVAAIGELHGLTVVSRDNQPGLRMVVAKAAGNGVADLARGGDRGEL